MHDIRRIDDHGDTYNIPYNPADRDTHRWEDYFKDIPLTMVRDATGVWLPSPGAIVLPHTAARLAEHVELCGFTLDPAAARIRRVDLPRGAHRWQDASLPVPDTDPVDKVHVAVTETLTDREKKRLIDRLSADLEIGDTHG
jgi:hypothetical protein